MCIYLNEFCTGTGSSGSKCSDAYRGPQPFSEVEMRNIRNYVLALNPVPILAMNLHSYGQYYLWPYGYAFGTNYPNNYEEIVSLDCKSSKEFEIQIKHPVFLQRDLAEEAVAALKSVHGTVYQPINSAGLCKMNDFVSTLSTTYLLNLKFHF